MIYNKLDEAGVNGEVKKMICILHPRVDNPAGFRDDHGIHTAYVAIDDEIRSYIGDDVDDEFACCFCGDRQVMTLETCKECSKNMCLACMKDAGGSCAFSQKIRVLHLTVLYLTLKTTKPQRLRRSRSAL